MTAANRNAIHQPEAPLAAPDAVDCTGITLGNDDITCTRGQPQRDTANTLPIYPKPVDLP